LRVSDQNNFINFCSGKIITNGLQTQGGSCNPIVMGDIPAKGRMISAVFTNPKNGQNIQANTDFTISVRINNLAAGTFTDPDSTYYSAPQQVNGGGIIIGHTHVTVQDMGNNLNPENPPDAAQFAFFKGINDAGNGAGLLSAAVDGGLPAGNYRVCSMTSASNHQPVTMPVAQRGAQDDCVRFTVGGNGGNGGGNNGGQNGGNNGGQNGGNNGGQNGGNNGGQNGGNNGGQNGGNNGGNGGNNGGNGGNNGGNGGGQNGGNNGGNNGGKS
jgi:transcription initiation factor TFIID subunit 15